MAKKKIDVVTQDFIKRVDAGEEKTAVEWAIEFYNDEDPRRIYSMMSKLRERGLMIFGVPINGPEKPNVIKNITRDETWLPWVFNRHATLSTEPMIARAAKYAEAVVDAFPRRRDEVMKIFKSIVNRATEANKHLIGIPYARSASKGSKAE